VTRVRTTYLEMGTPAALKPSGRLPEDVRLVKVDPPSPELNRFLYVAVGDRWHWRDRLAWTRTRWMEWLERTDVETWVAYRGDAPAGYFELEAQEGGNVEIAYFGILPGFEGQGLGGYLVTEAARRAFAMRPGVGRVWLHTCTLDHPGALPNYLTRGFAIFREEEADVMLPERTPGAERTG
jgi:GNAT superfamily N-acetyltransferase